MTMRPIYQIDAFVAEGLRGNPAAVVVLDDWLPDEALQRIAEENNLSETAFVIPGADEVPLRWFTPTVEVELCGHATLASAHALFSHGYVPGNQIVFRYGGGTLGVRREGDRLVMDFPALPAVRVPMDPTVVRGLGAEPAELHRAVNLLAVFRDRAEVEALEPDFGVLAEIDAFAVIATAEGGNVDFVSRFFAPNSGVPEDPVTGSAHCTLVPYWAERLGKDRLIARQISTRGGELECENRGPRVSIGGRAREYLEGRIDLRAIS